MSPARPEAAKTASFPLAARDDRTNLDTILVPKRVVFGHEIVPSNNEDAFWYQIEFLQQILHTFRSGDVHFPNRMVEKNFHYTRPALESAKTDSFAPFTPARPGAAKTAPCSRGTHPPSRACSTRRPDDCLRPPGEFSVLDLHLNLRSSHLTAHPGICQDAFLCPGDSFFSRLDLCLAQENGRFLREDGIDIETGPPFKAGDLGQLRNDLDMPMIEVPRRFAQGRCVKE